MPFEDDLIEVVTPERVGLNFPIAGLGSRLGAALWDIFFIFLFDLVIVIVVSLFDVSFIDEENRYVSSVIGALVILAIFLVHFGYFIFFEYKYNGQTPGKRMMKIRTIRLNGLPLDFTSAMIRNLMRIVDIILFASSIGFLIIFLSKLSQHPGDYVAGTVVIHDQTVKLDDLNKYLKKTDKESMSPKIENRFKKLSEEDARLIDLYMDRRLGMELEARRKLAKQIASEIRSKAAIQAYEFGGNENLIRIAREALRDREKGKW